MNCTTCKSPKPHLFPAIQFEGEVADCLDEFHLQVTPENTPARIAEREAIWGRSRPGVPPEKEPTT